MGYPIYNRIRDFGTMETAMKFSTAFVPQEAKIRFTVSDGSVLVPAIIPYMNKWFPVTTQRE